MQDDKRERRDDDDWVETGKISYKIRSIVLDDSFFPLIIRINRFGTQIF
jgi:hypothetical protein